MGPVRLAAGSVALINANNVLEHVPDLPALMGNCLTLLATGGELHIEVPYEGAPTAWQDPTHVRAMNENSWLYYTDWFWYLGWFEHRFAVESSDLPGPQLKPCGKQAAAFMRLVLRKTETSDAERTTARTMQSELRSPTTPSTPATSIGRWLRRFGRRRSSVIMRRAGGRDVALAGLPRPAPRSS